METIEYCGNRTKIHKYKKFFRMGFIIESERIKLEERVKPLFLFNVYTEDYYAGSVEFHGSTLKLAKKKLEKWLLKNFPDEFNFDPLYQRIGYKDNYYIRIHYVNKIIRDNGEDLYKYCPSCGFKTYSQASHCKECNHVFFLRY